MEKLRSSTQKKIDKLKELIKKGLQSKKKDLSDIIGRKSSENERLFNTVKEMKSWLKNKELYKYFTDEELNFLHFDDSDTLEIVENEELIKTDEKQIEEEKDITSVVSLKDVFSDEKKVNKFLYLMNNIDKVVDLIEKREPEKLIIPDDVLNLKSEPYSIRANQSVISKFNKLADKYKGYPRYALINLAFLEFIEKYQK